jgi:peptide/nickel transport system ATP-binding protein
MAYLEIQNLSVLYSQGGVHAVRDCNLQLNRGETLGIVGESGSGKSTLALALLRMFSPKTAEISGNVMLEGREVLNLPLRNLIRFAGRRWLWSSRSP